MEIRIADTQFAHGTSLGSGDLKIFPKNFTWYRGDRNINDIIVITESMFGQTDQFTEKIKIAWLLEPVSINPDSYRQIEYGLWTKFDYILTHNLDFIQKMTRLIADSKALGSFKKHPQVLWAPFGGCWILPQDRQIYPKTKGISIIASDKKQTEGHRLRHEAIAALKGKVDVFGRGYNPIDYKLDALKDYKFSIVIENERTPGFFTEKLIDCILTGTIPLYWGDPQNQYLSIKPFSNIDELITYIDTCIIEPGWGTNSWVLKTEQMDFDIAQSYACPEDWLYHNFFMKQQDLRERLIKHYIL